MGREKTYLTNLSAIDISCQHKMSSPAMNIEDYAWSQEYECPESPVQNRNNRARKVTVTDITEEIDDWEMVIGSDEDERTSTEEMSDDEDSSDDGEENVFDDDQDDKRAK